jgi:hypothetical protein
MGASYYIVNTTKRQFFCPGDLLSGDRFTGLLNGLSGHAVAVLIQDNRQGAIGLWAGDALYAIGDSSLESAVHRASSGSYREGIEAWEILRSEFLNITSALVAYLCEHDFGEGFLKAAESNEILFVNLANLVEQHGLKKFGHAFLKYFGSDWRRRYDQTVRQLDEWHRIWDLEAVRSLM